MKFCILVCITFSYVAVNSVSAITAVEAGFICKQNIGPIWCICEIDSRRQISLQEVSPDYSQSALEQSTLDFVVVTSGHDVQQSVQFCCLGPMQLDWRGVNVIWDSEERSLPISRGRPERWRSPVLPDCLKRLKNVAMNTNMSSDNVLYQSSLEHTNSTHTLIFDETWQHF
jgi:hypothetical protein